MYKVRRNIAHIDTVKPLLVCEVKACNDRCIILSVFCLNTNNFSEAHTYKTFTLLENVSQTSILLYWKSY